MFPKMRLLSVTLLAVMVSASPVSVRDDTGITLSFARSLNLTDGITMADLDRTRAAHIMDRGKQMEAFQSNGTLNKMPIELAKRAASISVTNTAVTYTADVQIGSPATTYTLLIDTGSSNTWIGASKKYPKTSSTKATGNRVSVSYGSGSFSGYECVYFLL